MRILAAFMLSALAVQVIANPVVIAHRGASGYLPEHTLEAAALAYNMGSDYIEQDLVLSRDGVPVVLHDIYLDTVTNVATRFPDRKRDDGRYYVIDFDLAELKTLTVHERRKPDGEQVFPNRYQGSGHFTIATFEEHIELIQNLNRLLGRRIGMYPEIKAPAWHREAGHEISRIVIEIIRKHGLDRSDANVYLQCFDFNEIRRIAKEFRPALPLVQLIGYRSSTTDYEHLRTEAGVKEMKEFVRGVGPAIPHMLSFEDGELKPSEFAGHLARHGLEVHPYTHREDQLPPGLSSDVLLQALFESGATGVFTDFPDVVRAFIDQLLTPEGGDIAG